MSQNLNNQSLQESSRRHPQFVAQSIMQSQQPSSQVPRPPRSSTARSRLTSGIGGNAIEQTNPDRAQLIKGFQAQFWFSFGSATLAALGALTLKIGRRGTHDEIHEARRAEVRQEREMLTEEETGDRKIGSEERNSEN